MGGYNSVLSGSLVFRDNGSELSSIVPSPDAINITGSLRVKGAHILLNGSDLAYRITVLEAGQGADQVNFGELFLYTASTNEWTSSAKISLTNLNNTSASLLQFTASQEVINADLIHTASRLDYTASNHETRIVNLEDSGLVSGSQQIYELGFLSSSIQGIVSSSAQIWDLGFITASRWQEILEIPDGIISSSEQIDNLQDPSLITTGSITASVEINGNVFEIISASNTLFTVNSNGSISSSIVNAGDEITLSGENILQTILDHGIFAVTGSHISTNKDVEVTGSFSINLDGVTEYFSINVGGDEKVKVNEEGVFQLFGYATTPTAVQGGFYYDDGDEFYLGFNT